MKVSVFVSIIESIERNAVCLSDSVVGRESFLLPGEEVVCQAGCFRRRSLSSQAAEKAVPGRKK